MKEISMERIDFVNNEADFKYSLNLTPTKEDIKEMLSKIDIDLIKESIQIFNSGVEVEDEALDKILRMWAISKFPFYVLFKRNLTYEKSVSFNISDDKFSENLHELFRKRNILRNNKKNEFVNTERFILYHDIITSIDIDSLKRNICPSHNGILKSIPDYKVGQKASKFFSRFFGDSDFDIEYSKLLQVKNGGEKIIISINPMDYLTCSWNDKHWTSCYSPGGCHSEGLLELIFDKSTCVAYISHNDFSPFGNRCWNSKIIRSFVHISRYDSSFAISRCYPNVENEGFYIAVKETVASCIKSFFNIKNKPLRVMTVTQKMDSGSCFGQYALSGERENLRIHVDPSKRVTRTDSHMVFCDPVKYLCSFDDKMVIIKVGTSTSVCTACGKVTSKFVRRLFICKECY